MEKIANSAQALLSISVVSHGQMNLISGLMQDIQKYCTHLKVEFILTLNLDEPLPFHVSDFFYPVKVIRNLVPKGFGANHNQAFGKACGQYFCVINPDIRFEYDPFSALLANLNNPTVGVIAPLVVGPNGDIEDSARRFPTPSVILSKVFGQCKQVDYSFGEQLIEPDWVGGMFMLFACQVFQQLHGFDERYFLYYEDVDLCGRLQLTGYRVAVCTGIKVVHHAQRSSHRSLKFLRWHLASMLRFFFSPVYRQLKTSRCA
ncbi:MAG: glycosyltransferase family 2 protein [Rhodoferax sp.]|nr:glycosyltransferase family 2 protein [Betaproteobacteria bacterium]NCN96375.1 glycosyltransferase family 2 protein [Rhodoferax sp.]OIP13219.1 MAG: glycosyl transferase [Comamonadaceae bacterium CG2_30_57_122]PIZ21901.1 MAG: glycosyl transferase [Comamonadaceae bacterium CG_4_10_14_0_8_um_filter_57_29]PJC21080.1 MAG: glycosyl transferase [Comamonadaceae bacterium CG_4_9_14_0_8_um_filter_57_21]